MRVKAARKMLMKLTSELGQHASWKKSNQIPLSELIMFFQNIILQNFCFRKFYCSQFSGHDHAECEHFVHNFAKPAFNELGAHLAASATEACVGLFDCQNQPTEEPTEEPTEGPTENPDY